jgi:predicted RNA binding protein YcfA (HicA-like mRNA interferase family)
VKVPRDVSGRELLRALTRLGYQLARQKGSHVIATTQVRGEHHVAVPMHDPIKIGTFNNILRDVGQHHGLTRDELLEQLELD